MNIRTRVGKLEQQRHGGNAEVFIDVLIYEAPPGGVEDEEIVTAQVMWGVGKVAGFKRESGETTEAFTERMDKVGELSWLEAKQKYKLEA